MKDKIIKILFFSALAVFYLPSADSVSAAECSPSSIRWAGSSNRIYLQGGAFCTLSQIKSLGSAQISLSEVLDKVWYLENNIVLQGGSTLLLHGDDVKELRLKSDSGGHVSITAQYGNIDISDTKITSWDESEQGPDKSYQNGRAFMRVRSYLDGSTPRESRMDIKNSDVGYLGYYAAESYGLAWKVLGFSSEIYEEVGVYGEVTNSSIHHNYFGAYTYGGQDMSFINNEVNDNIVYGLDPHDDSDYIQIIGNNVHNNGYHGIICSRRCDNIEISGNTSSYNQGNGIMLHRSVTDSVVKDNKTEHNEDSGIAVFESLSNRIFNNTANFNDKYGIRLSLGSSDNIIEDNEFSYNESAGMFFYKGSNPAEVGDGRLRNNLVQRNDFISNNNGIKLKESDENIFKENKIVQSKGYSLYLHDSDNNEFTDNDISGTAAKKIKITGGSSGNTIE